MSLLVWSQAKDHFAILTDTLATMAKNHERRAFNSNLWPIPCLDLVIGGTGARLFVSAWARWVGDSGVVDVDELHALAPASLRQLYQVFLRDVGNAAIGTASTSTIYHFSIDSAGRAVRHTYRSTSDFEPEEHRDVELGMKPTPPDGRPLPFTDKRRLPFTNLEEMIAAALELRRLQDERPAEERVHIGGELYLTMVCAGEIFTQRVHRFVDYEEMSLSM
jgi:hypothetical protein